MVTFEQTARYAKALARWVAAGRPTRSDAEVSRIFETICRPCERFGADEQACRACGCRIVPAGPALLNKIAMGTERCPLGKWEAQS